MGGGNCEELLKVLKCTLSIFSISMRDSILMTRVSLLVLISVLKGSIWFQIGVILAWTICCRSACKLLWISSLRALKSIFCGGGGGRCVLCDCCFGCCIFGVLCMFSGYGACCHIIGQLLGLFGVEVREFIGIKGELEFVGWFVSWRCVELCVSVGGFGWLKFAFEGFGIGGGCCCHFHFILSSWRVWLVRFIGQVAW